MQGVLLPLWEEDRELGPALTRSGLEAASAQRSAGWDVSLPMPDKPPPPPKPNQPDDPSVYGGQWGEGDGHKKPAGTPPTDRPDKIDQPPEQPASQGGEPPPDAQAGPP